MKHTCTTAHLRALCIPDLAFTHYFAHEGAEFTSQGESAPFTQFVVFRCEFPKHLSPSPHWVLRLSSAARDWEAQQQFEQHQLTIAATKHDIIRMIEQQPSLTPVMRKHLIDIIEAGDREGLKAVLEIINTLRQ